MTENESKGALGTLDEVMGEITSLAPYLSGGRKDLDDFIEAFGENIPTQAELSISPHDRAIGIMTGAAGPDFVEKVRGYLRRSGMNEDSIGIFDMVEEYFPNMNLLVKQEFSETEGFEFTLYWQYLLPIRYVPRLTRNLPIGREAKDFFQEACLLLRAKSVYLGMGFRQPDLVPFRAIFSNNLKKSESFISPAITGLMAKAGLRAEIMNYFIGIHEFLSREAVGSVFTSLGMGGSAPDMVKTDYEIVPPGHVVEIMKALNIPMEEKDRLKEAMEILQMDRLTYLGIKYPGSGLPRLKYYFNRRFSMKNRESAAALADFIRNTVWLS